MRCLFHSLTAQKFAGRRGVSPISVTKCSANMVLNPKLKKRVDSPIESEWQSQKKKAYNCLKKTVLHMFYFYSSIQKKTNPVLTAAKALGCSNRPTDQCVFTSDEGQQQTLRPLDPLKRVPFFGARTIHEHFDIYKSHCKFMNPKTTVEKKHHDITVEKLLTCFASSWPTTCATQARAPHRRDRDAKRPKGRVIMAVMVRQCWTFEVTTSAFFVPGSFVLLCFNFFY